jgi:hypothetical protein
MAAVSEGIEASLWMAIRALEEGHMLMEAMAEHLKNRHGDGDSALLMDGSLDYFNTVTSSPSSHPRTSRYGFFPIAVRGCT